MLGFSIAVNEHLCWLQKQINRFTYNNIFLLLFLGALENWLQMIYEEDHLYHDRMLAIAAVIVEEMRAAVLKETGYKCSAGIAHNKVRKISFKRNEILPFLINAFIVLSTIFAKMCANCSES